jgi:ABC-type amino acid transport substrate-binding protein
VLRRLLPVAGAAALALALPASADWPAIRQAGALRVLAHRDAERPQFFSTDPAAPGFDHELLQGFAALHKLRLQIIDIPGGPEGRVAALLEGKGDLAAGRLVVSESRRRRIDMTVDVFPLRYVIVTRRPTPVVAKLDDLRDLRVGVVKGATAYAFLVEAKIPPAHIDDSFPESGAYAAGLRAGKVSAVVWGVDSAIVAQRADPALQLGGFVGAPGAYAYGIRKGNPELLARLNEYVANVRRTPTWNRLAVKYFGDSAVEVLKKARGE